MQLGVIPSSWLNFMPGRNVHKRGHLHRSTTARSLALPQAAWQLKPAPASPVSGCMVPSASSCSTLSRAASFPAWSLAPIQVLIQKPE